MDQAEQLRNVIKLHNQNNQNNARVVTITSGKGGVGKSNLAVNLAVCLRKAGKRVIIFDADFGLANVEVMFGAIPQYNLSDFIYRGKSIREIITPGPMDIGFISGGSGIIGLNNLTREQILYIVNSIDTLNELADFILIDTGAGISDQVLEFVMASPEVLLVSTPEPSSLTDAYSLLKALYRNPNFVEDETTIHVVTNRVNSQDEGRAIYEKVNSVVSQFLHGSLNYLGMIPQDAALDYYMKSLTDVFEQCAAADTIAAIVVEPLQGEGGFIPAPIEWVKAVRKLCDDNGILLIADEVQSGFCRTGRMFASMYWEEAGVQPDIIATAKSIAAGVPLSAIVARKEIMEAAASGTIGGTFCGNPLACAAALKTIEIMERDHLAERSCEIGKKVTERYLAMKEKYNCIGDVRGLGGMIGIEFVKDKETKEPAPELTAAVINTCAKNGLLVEGAGTYNNVIRFLAPLVITDEQLAVGLDIFEKAVVTAMEG